MIFSLMLFVLVTMAFFPEAPTSRFLHRILAEPVARWLNSLSWMNFILIAAVIVAGTLMTLLFGAEGLRVFSMMAPEGLVWLTLVDASILIDLFVVGTVLAGVARVKAMREFALMRLRTTGAVIISILRAGRQRARRARPKGAVKPRRNDDPDPFGLAYA